MSDAKALSKWHMHLDTYQDWPKPGVLFWDFSPMLRTPAIWDEAIAMLASHAWSFGVNKIAALDARGFIVASAVQAKLNASHPHVGMIMIRKPGKLPGAVYTNVYDLEYGSNSLSVQTNAITTGDRVYIADDLLATGGTTRAAIDLVRECGGTVMGAGFVIEIDDLNGKEKLRDIPYRSVVSV